MTPEDPDSQHLCAMCSRPAYIRRDGQRGRYCTAGPCSNPRRRCPVCGSEFKPWAGEANNKFCTDRCRLGYAPEVRSESPQVRGRSCAWCGVVGGGMFRQGRWPYICEECQYPIRHVVERLKNHKVPHEWAKILIERPGCQICGVNLLTPVRQDRGKMRALLVVDHDHRCCPEGRSCGECIKGFLCNDCNAGIGFLKESVVNVQQAAEYLIRAQARLGLP